VNGLPAFLTNPVRAPIAMESDAGVPGAEVGEGEPNGEFRARPRARRRRTSREFGAEAGPDNGQDFAPDAIETPPVE
jgi:hypothetical protein